MPLVAAAGISAGAGLLGGFLQSGAAKRAAEKQRIANLQAGQHLEQTVSTVNPLITAAAGRAADKVHDTTWNAITGVNEATGQANTKLDPYALAGSDASNLIRAGIQPGGDFNKVPTLSDLQMDPGYAFRTAEGTRAINASAAAHGGATGGGVLKDLARYQQGEASQEYQNAFNRFRQSMLDRFGIQNTVANRGFAAAGAQGNNLITGSEFNAGLATDSAKYEGNADIGQANQVAGNTIYGAGKAGEYLTGAGEAEASGIVGGANAWSRALTGGANGISQAILLNRLLKNPINMFTINPAYATNDLGGYAGAGPQRP